MAQFGKDGVADDARAVAVDDAVDADIDDHGAGLDPIAAHQAGTAGRDDDDVGGTDDFGQAAREDVRHLDRAFAFEQKQGDRLADDVRLADDHRFQAAKIVDDRLQQAHAAERRARHETARARRQPPDIDRVKAVDILQRIDRIEHGAGVDGTGQGQLHQYAVDGGIVVQLLDQVQQVVLGDFRRQTVFQRAHAGLARLGQLAIDVDFAGRVVADQDHGQRRHGAGLKAESRRIVRYAGHQGGGDGGPVNRLGHGAYRPLK